LTMTDTDFFNELLQPVLLGGVLHFTVEVTENFVSAPNTVPDAFSLTLLDTEGTPFPTDDPNGTNLLAVAGAHGLAPVFSLQAQAIPEPSLLGLVSVAVALLVTHGSARRSRAGSLAHGEPDSVD